MSEPDHLTDDEVRRIIGYIDACDPIVVGGQSINLWSRYFGILPDAPLTSSDIDFYHNPLAAKVLAKRLDGKLVVPGMEDPHTPNSAVVVGMLDERRIVVDFLSSVAGVPDSRIRSNFVAIRGRIGDALEPARILLMHPLDCLRSRIANVNQLRRHDGHTLLQSEAAVLALDRFVDELVSKQAFKAYQGTLFDLSYVARDAIGSAWHGLMGDRPQPLAILRKYCADERIDPRWRERTLLPALNRVEDRSARYSARTEDEPSATRKPG